MKCILLYMVVFHDVCQIDVVIGVGHYVQILRRRMELCEKNNYHYGGVQ